MKTRNIGLTMVLLLVLANIALVLAGDSGGTANVGNVDPEILSVTFTQDNTAIDVDTTYTVTANIRDNNTLEQLDYIDYILWDSVTTTEGGADDETDHYTFRYDEDLDSWEEIGPDSAGDSHLVVGSCSDPADHTGTTGDFTLGFKLHKTANREATTTSWKITIKVYDESAANDSDQSKTYGVTFYIELAVDDGSHSWSSLNPGSNDNQIDSPVDGDIDLTITANADFDMQAKGDGALTSGGNTIPLSNVKIHKDTLGSAVSLTVSYADVGGLTAQSAGEDLAKAFILWLSVPGGQQPGAYTYTCSVQAVEA